MLLIHINDVRFIISGIRTAANRIDPSTSSVPSSPSCSGIMIDTYYDRIVQIGKLMKKYQQLLVKDMNDVQKTQKSFIELDSQIGVTIAKIGDAKAVPVQGGAAH